MSVHSLFESWPDHKREHARTLQRVRWSRLSPHVNDNDDPQRRCAKGVMRGVLGGIVSWSVCVVLWGILHHG